MIHRRFSARFLPASMRVSAVILAFSTLIAATAPHEASTSYARTYRNHDLVGPKAIGAAINALDAKDLRLRINRVRYYTFQEFKGALLASDAGKKKSNEIAALLR